MECKLPELLLLIGLWSCIFSICSYYFITSTPMPLVKKCNLSEEFLTERKSLLTISKNNNNSGHRSPDNASTAFQFNETLKTQLKEALNKSQNKEFTILIWAAMYRIQNPYTVDPVACGRCRVTYDRSTVSENDTKAVIFHYSDFSLYKMPLNRSHSDVYFPYFTAKDVLKSLQESSSGDARKDIDELMKAKTGFALWAVSNCDLTSFARNRMQFSNELIKAGLVLDRVGRCFFKKHLRSVKMARNYKFYMSFENGYHCNDYITEKFFKNALKFGAVPVVLGAKKSDYETFAPPNSYIYAEDFETPAKLVEYLNHLDKNDTAYKEYFKWRTLSLEDMPQPYRASGFCHLCRILHGINVDNMYNPLYKDIYSDIPLFGYPQKPRTVGSLPKFFYETEDRECLPDY